MRKALEYATRQKARHRVRFMQILKHSHFSATPWKNGGGITLEAIRVPPGAEAYRWRVSIAHIDRPGPFSEFAGYRRIMVLLEGNGAALAFADGRRMELRRVGDLAEFDGAAAVQCELIDGKCTDLNLIAANSLGGMHAAVEHARGRRKVQRREGHSTLVLGVDAPLAIDVGEGRALLGRWDLAVIEHTDPEAHFESQAPGGSALVFQATVPDA